MDKYLYLRTEYDGELRLYGRNLQTGKNKMFTITDFPAYFYVDADAEVPWNHDMIATKPGFTSLMGKKVKKILFNSPNTVRHFREKFDKTWESDIPFKQRFAIDVGLKVYFNAPDKDIISYKEIITRDADDIVGLDDIRFRYNYMYFDIEVLPEDINVFVDVEKAEQPIISIGAGIKGKKNIVVFVFRPDLEKKKVKDGNLIICYHNKEREMINAFFDFMEQTQTDIPNCWYAEFDVSYVINRCMTLGMKSRFSLPPFEDSLDKEREAMRRVKGRMIFDLKKGYQRLAKTTQNSLNDALIREGFEAKHGKATDIIDYYENDLDKLIEYNKYDVQAMILLDEKIHITDFFELTRKISGLDDYELTLFAQLVIDPILLRIAKQEGIILPNKGPKQKVDKYEGALVFEPVGGFHDWVFILDLRRFYPSIFMSLNLSKETICEDGDIDCGNFKTKSEPIGLTTLIYMVLWKNRQVIESKMRRLKPGTGSFDAAKKSKDAIKNTSNAVYGMASYSRARLFEPMIAAKITEVARDIIRLVSEIVTEEFNDEAEMIYGDTDSVMVKSKKKDITLKEILDLMKRVEDVCNVRIKEYIKEKYHVEPHEFVGLDAEKVGSMILFPETKKRYAMNVKWEKGMEVDYTYIVGLEVKRRDAAQITKDLQKDVLEMIFRKEPKDKIVKYVNSLIRKIENDDFKVEEIAIPKGIGDNLESYGGINKRGGKKGIPAHIRGALYSNKHLGTNFVKGSKVMMLYVSRVIGLPYQTDIICFDDTIELPEIVIAKQVMIEKIIESKIKKIIEVVGISWGLCRAGRSISDFFAKK